MPNYTINGGSEIPGVNSSWQRLKKQVKVDNQTTFTNMAINRWRLPLMSMANFEIFRAAQGDSLTSLNTNDPDDRDAFLQYTTAVMSLLNGRHQGLNMRDVTVEFYVDLNSEV